MRIGLIGQPGEPHCLAVQRALAGLGAEGVLVDASTFDADRRFGIEGTRLTVGDADAADFGAFYLRSILSPVPTVYVEDDEFRLYEDWHQSYMLAREKHGFLLAWLLGLLAIGKPVINPPHLGTVSLLKPYQLLRLGQLGFPTPRTCVTNDPAVARRFIDEVGRAIAKPVVGGAFAEEMTPEHLDRLDLVRAAPAIFQELVEGQDIRITAVANQILSCVAIESDCLDFRAADGYEQGLTGMEPVSVPGWVEDMCLHAMEVSELGFTAIDLKRRGEDDYVILELNFSPAFLWVEQKTGHPISEGLARFLLACAEQAAMGRPWLGPEGARHEKTAPEPPAPVPDRDDAAIRPQARRQRQPSFFDYGLPRPSAVASSFTQS